ncbi:MAG: sigma 54-interacting transcriptional regulator [Vicinamibacteria bacterium]|nr:sigma 54-interacting transcriptional regulator [Vicinamibacteria bacterium]
MECHEVRPVFDSVASGASSHIRQARCSLRDGHYARAIEHLRLARRRPLDIAPALMALIEIDALLHLRRYREALALCGRALKRRPEDADLTARLRIASATALWHLGEIRRALRESNLAAQRAKAEATLARLAEVSALLSWREHDVERAIRHLWRARSLYLEIGLHDGVDRTFEQEASILRDAGRLDEALQMHAKRIERLVDSGRSGALARARAELGAVFVDLGKWDTAREELRQAVRLFQETGDVGENFFVDLQHAAVEMAAGDLDAARSALEHGRETGAKHDDDPRSAAEILLLLTDIHLALSDASAAERSAAEATALFGLARDEAGQIWGWIRRSQALLELGREREALVQSRRAVHLAPVTRRHLRAWAHLALGRILLRLGDGTQAKLGLEQALRLSAGRQDMQSAARLGLAMAHDVEADDPRVVTAIHELERFGDRPLLTLCLREVRAFFGDRMHDDTQRLEPQEIEIARDATMTTIVDLARDLYGSGGVAEALKLFGRTSHDLLGWSRIVVLLGRDAWQLRSSEAGVTSLPPDDLAWELVRRATLGGVIDLLAAPGLWTHPTRALYGLAYTVLIPMERGACMCVDFRDRPTDRQYQMLLETARLIEPYLVPSNAEREQAPDGIIGSCPAILKLRDITARVATSDDAIHIYGETGTGKELFARAVHDGSARRTGPFVPVNAAAIPETLFEAQMFGHAKGAFTGADRALEGYVSRAEGGTLFLDEVADLTPLGQSKLLRFCEDGTYCRLGETTPRRADVRLVTAANVELRVRVDEGCFRQDLMYRLQGFVLRLPPLRERGADVIELARFFVQAAAKKRGKPAPRITPEVARVIESHAWPGNVRELAREMRRLVTLAESGRLSNRNFSPEVLDAVSIRKRPLRETRMDHERSRIIATLADHAGNRSRTAAALGISRQALLLKIKRLGIA